MRRPLAILVFAIAAGAMTAASAGLVVVPHVDPPGSGPLHEHHVLAAYRLPLFLDVSDARIGQGEVVAMAEGLFDAAGAIVLALLALLWPRLSRPTLRAVGEIALARIAPAQWQPPRTTGPPRPALHR